ncbi:MAG: VanZ family protein [Gammaproteobacteria bacterium]|nr:VanZ family protein [Gammaproteobacteria bacterium]
MAWLIFIGIWYLSLTSRPPDVSSISWGDKWGHLLAYATLMYWFGSLYPRRQRTKIAYAFVTMGVAIEFIQGTTGYRTFEFADMAADTLGVVVALVVLRYTRISFFVWVEQAILKLYFFIGSQRE